MAAPHITKLTVACCTLYCSAPLSRPAEIQQAQNLLPALAATLPCHGPIAVVYPEGVWYDRLTPLVLERIIEEHLLGGHTVSAHVMMGSRAADHDPNVLPALDITRWVFVGVSKQLGLCVCDGQACVQQRVGGVVACLTLARTGQLHQVCLRWLHTPHPCGCGLTLHAL